MHTCRSRRWSPCECWSSPRIPHAGRTPRQYPAAGTIVGKDKGNHRGYQHCALSSMNIITSVHTSTKQTVKHTNHRIMRCIPCQTARRCRNNQPALDTVWKESSSTELLYGSPMLYMTFLALRNGRSSWYTVSW